MNDSRLKNYALTAGGAAALAATGLAGADIQKSSATTTIDVGQPETLFTLLGITFQAFNTQGGSWSLSGSARAYFRGTNTNVQFSMVSSGVSIGSGFSGNSYSIWNSMLFSGGSMASSSDFLTLGSGEIVGFSLTDSGDNYYGWIAYDLSMSEGEYTFTVNGWAYNDVANEGIIAGQNQAAGSSAVPGLGGLAALAIGAAGVRSRRQRTVA